MSEKKKFIRKLIFRDNVVYDTHIVWEMALKKLKKNCNWICIFNWILQKNKNSKIILLQRRQRFTYNSVYVNVTLILCDV